MSPSGVFICKVLFSTCIIPQVIAFVNHFGGFFRTIFIGWKASTIMGRFFVPHTSFTPSLIALANSSQVIDGS